MKTKDKFLEYCQYEKNNSDTQRRYLYLEIMRIFACFFVIFNHTNDYGFFLFSQRSWGSIQFWLYLFVSVFCKFSVPLFLMISGALLLTREQETLKTLWLNRIARIAAILLIFSFIQYIRAIHRGDQTWNISKFFLQLYESNWSTSYWYLYAYLQMLITLPFLRTLARNLEDRHYYYLFALALFFNAILPIFQFLLWKDGHSINGNLRVGWLTGSTVLYPLMGYFLQNRIHYTEKKGRILIILWSFNVFTIIVCCIMTYLKARYTGECSESTSQAFHSSFVMVNTSAIFLLTKYLTIKYEDKLAGWLKNILFRVGRATFGIYLWHTMVLNFLGSHKIWEFFRGRLKINHMISAFLVCLCTMVVSYGLTRLMQKIPYVKRLVS